MSCRFDRKPGNSYIYVEFPGFRPDATKRAVKKMPFRGRTWRKCYYFVYKRVHVSVGQKSRIQHHNGRKVPSPSSVSRQPWFPPGDAAGALKGPSRGAPGLLWWWGTPPAVLACGCRATGFPRPGPAGGPGCGVTRMTGSPQGTRGHTGVLWHCPADSQEGAEFHVLQLAGVHVAPWISMWMPSSWARRLFQAEDAVHQGIAAVKT